MWLPHSLGLPLEICQLQLFIKLYTAIVKCEGARVRTSEQGRQTQTCGADSRLEARCGIVSHSSSSRQLFVCAEFKHFVELHLRRQRLTALFGVLHRVYAKRYIWDFLFIFAYSSANPWSPCPKHVIDNISSGLDCSAPLRGGIRQIDNSLKRFVRHLKAE